MRRRFRVTRNEDFQTIIRQNHSFAGKNFVVYYSLTTCVTNDRAGISVSKRLGNAVVRNKVKRQVRMMISEITDFKRGADLIVIVRKNYMHNDYRTNKKELNMLCEKVYNNLDALIGGCKNEENLKQ